MAEVKSVNASQWDNGLAESEAPYDTHHNDFSGESCCALFESLGFTVLKAQVWDRLSGRPWMQLGIMAIKQS